MNTYLELLVIFPLAAFAISLILPNNERLISWASFTSVGLHFLAILIFLGYWIWLGAEVMDVKDVSIFKGEHYEYFIDFYLDSVTAVYLSIGAFLTFLVTLYSRYYMHREGGYKRFFNTILFFYVGYNLIVLAGNLETLFIGWEMLGISSFLLIAFYRERYLPVKNAVKVFSIYRLGDVGLILAMWMSHHLFQENITFHKLHNTTLVHAHLEQHSWVGIFISLMILITAAAKSAQFPFSSWLPRAMEGPTPSSAIFYGSLSVHLGVFLMLRTYPFWQEQISVRWLIALMGLTTAIITTGIARVQSSVKSQIAYASIAQIGLIFIEIALGWHILALVHFSGNAFLRTYQLLVSPSVVSYLIREQFYSFKPHKTSIEDSLPRKLENSLYILCLKEWNLDNMMYHYLWNPLKKLGNSLGLITTSKVLMFFIPVYVMGVGLLLIEDKIPSTLHHALPIVFACIGLLMVLKAFTERIHARMAWVLILMNHFWIALAISFNEHFTFYHTAWYLSGIFVSGAIGYTCLYRIKILEGSIDLDQFHGHVHHHKKITLVFLIAALGAMGFPITPTFIGEDLIFSHIHEDQIALAALVALSFIIDGLAIVRILARVFMGPHARSVYDMAYRSS